MANAVPQINSQVDDIIINPAHPLKDYQRLIETKVTVDSILDDAIIKDNFKRIANAVHNVIWQLLFDGEGEAAAAESQKNAGELLAEYKNDASFYAPMPYNEWIVKLRDELLKRNKLVFWREQIVANQLGPCWSRDSDLFDSEDEPPLEFYAHAGCVAPFAASLKVRAAEKAASEMEEAGQKTERKAEIDADNAAALASSFEAKIDMDQPVNDYRDLMKRFVQANVHLPDEVLKKNLAKIEKATWAAVWKLLFEGSPAQQEFDKAAELLLEYKSDCCFYSPWQFNDWIVKLRDELLRHPELLQFWSEKIVKLELGPCCVRDSDYFEGDDPLPLDFYNKAGCKAPFTSNED